VNRFGEGDLRYKWYCTKGTDTLDKDLSKYQGFGVWCDYIVNMSV